MEDILYCKDLHEPIEGDAAKPESMSDAEWKKMNRKNIINQLATMKMTIEELQALLLLGSLLDSWETFVVSISNSASNGVLTLDNVKNSMLNEETRRKTSGIDSSQVFVTENCGRSKSRGPKGHGKNPSRSKSRFKGTCHHCGKEGNMKKNCRVWKREQMEGNNQKKDDTGNTIAVICGDVPEILYVSECLHMGNSDKDIEWIFLPCYVQTGVLQYIQRR
ncbi:hypothetical protein ACFX1Z_043726 [Malus domestica]